MNENEIAIKLNDYGHEIQGIKDRLVLVENMNTQMNTMALNIQKLAINIESMAEAQKDTNAKLRELEKAPIEDSRYYRRLIVGCVITGFVGAIIGVQARNPGN